MRRVIVTRQPTDAQSFIPLCSTSGAWHEYIYFDFTGTSSNPCDRLLIGLLTFHKMFLRLSKKAKVSFTLRRNDLLETTALLNN